MLQDPVRTHPDAGQTWLTKGVSVKRSVLILAAALAVTACNEVSTAPQVDGLGTAENRFSNPPPPPIEATAVLSVGSTSFAASLGAISQQAVCEGDFFGGTFVIPATYMFNPVQNAGFVHFESYEDEDLTASANGMVRKQGDDDPTGHGTLTFLINGCELVVHLDSVTEAVFGECTNIITGDVDLLAAPEDNPEQGCFHLEFDEVTFNGTPVPGGATVNGFPEDEDPPEVIIG